MKTVALVTVSLCACSAVAVTTEFRELATSTVDCSDYAFPTSLAPVPISKLEMPPDVATTLSITLGASGSHGSLPASTSGAGGGGSGGGSGGESGSGSGGGSERGGEGGGGGGSGGSNGGSPTTRGTVSGTSIVQVPTAGAQAIRPGDWALVTCIIGLLMAFQSF